jgi:hypothetical protein
VLHLSKREKDLQLLEVEKAYGRLTKRSKLPLLSFA